MANADFLRIREVGLQNFLGYGQYQSLTVGSLNLFIGKNNSGKSTLLRALALLGETLSDPSSDTSLLLSGNGLNLGVYEDAVFRSRRRSAMHMNLAFESESHERRFSSKISIDPVDRPNSISLTYREDQSTSRPFLSALTVYAPNGRLFTLQGGGSAKSIGFHSTAVHKPKEVLPRFDHFLPTFEIKPTASLRKSAPFLEVNEWSLRVRESLADLVYLGPSRAPLSALYLVTGAYPSRLDSTASNLIPLMARATRNKREAARFTKPFKRWLDDEFDLISEATLTGLLEGHAFRLKGIDPESKAKVALSNTGYGVSQVLPLIALLAINKPGILVVEQPELHLHPHAQAKLADLLLEFCRRGYQLFVETHSEHLVLRLRALFAQQMAKIAADGVRIFFVEKTKTGSIVRNVSIEESGRVANWPAGFFGISPQDVAVLVRKGAFGQA